MGKNETICHRHTYTPHTHTHRHTYIPVNLFFTKRDSGRDGGIENYVGGEDGRGGQEKRE